MNFALFYHPLHDPAAWWFRISCRHLLPELGATHASNEAVALKKKLSSYPQEWREAGSNLAAFEWPPGQRRIIRLLFPGEKASSASTRGWARDQSKSLAEDLRGGPEAAGKNPSPTQGLRPESPTFVFFFSSSFLSSALFFLFCHRGRHSVTWP